MVNYLEALKTTRAHFKKFGIKFSYADKQGGKKATHHRMRSKYVWDTGEKNTLNVRFTEALETYPLKDSINIIQDGSNVDEIEFDLIHNKEAYPNTLSAKLNGY